MLLGVSSVSKLFACGTMVAIGRIRVKTVAQICSLKPMCNVLKISQNISKDSVHVRLLFGSGDCFNLLVCSTVNVHYSNPNVEACHTGSLLLIWIHFV